MAEFFDFTVNLETGELTSRTVICSRCQKSPKVKEMLDAVKAIQNLPELKRVRMKRKLSPGEVGCTRCGTKITDTTQHVSLSCCWNVKKHRFNSGSFILCKDCYGKDQKTRAMWKYLAKIGKNPVFTPVLSCTQQEVCPTYEPGDDSSGCKHIAVMTVRETVEDDSSLYLIPERFNLVCNRGHEGALHLSGADPHLFPPHFRPQPIDPTEAEAEMEKTRKKQEEERNKLKENIELIQDPGLKAIFEQYFESYVGLAGALGI